MSGITFIAMVLGVILSALCGLACVSGSSAVSAQIGSVPGVDLLIAFPEAGLLLGIILIVTGVFTHPNRVR